MAVLPLCVLANQCHRPIQGTALAPVEGLCHDLPINLAVFVPIIHICLLTTQRKAQYLIGDYGRG